MISIIVAISKNNIIGKKNQLPWHYKEDLQYFKELTTNHTVVMGMNTFQSIITRNKRPLPNRKSVVVTRNLEFSYPNVEVIHDLATYLKKNHEEEIFIIGGKQIFDIALPFANRLYITHIDKEYVGDVCFSNIDYSKYKKISSRKEDELDFSIYERISL